MPQRFDNLQLSWKSPFVDFATAVFDTDLAAAGTVPRALYVGGAGDLAMNNRAGISVVFSGILAGTILPIRPNQLLAVGTTATLVLFLY